MLSQSTTGFIEGTWEEIVRRESEFNGHRLRVIILPDEPAVASNQIITKGMFPQLAAVTDDDFKEAEFHGDTDDGLDWSE